jgi:hypothetical protein
MSAYHGMCCIVCVWGASCGQVKASFEQLEEMALED